MKQDNGRPKTPDEVRELIIKIKLKTGYGYSKILQELAKLGINVSRQTVKNVLIKAGPHDAPKTSKDFWDAYLKRHADTMWQCDYLTKPMWTSKGINEYVHYRVYLHWNPRTPTSGWFFNEFDYC